jgi:hypothetical protein
MTQKWKTDPSLYSCKRVDFLNQSKKVIDYEKVYVNEFLNQDPLRDWESIERCKEFFNLCIIEKLGLDPTSMSFLDCGTKDGQMPEYLINEYNMEAIGLEISDPYIKWAQSKNRPVYKGDVCCMPKSFTEKFDIVFSHHLLGLTMDYYLGLCEMFRCVKIGGYLMTLNSVPGNKKKHYSYVESTKSYDEWLKTDYLNPHEVLYYGKGLLNGEVILLLKKTDTCREVAMERPKEL